MAGLFRDLAGQLALLEALQQMVADSDDADIIWDKDDRSQFMIVSDDGRTVKRHPPLPLLTTDGVRAKTGYKSGIHVWEITWPRSQRGDYASVGIATQSSTLQYLGQTDLIGGNDESVGWNLSKKLAMYSDCVISKYPENKPVSYQIPDKITVVLDMNVGILRYKVDGEDLGVCASGLRGKHALWYPAVSCDTNAIITIRKVQIPSPAPGLQPSQSVPRQESPQQQQVSSPSPSPSPTPSPTPPSEPLNFHRRCGKNVILSADKKSAERKDPLVNDKDGVAITEKPLQDGSLFSVKLVKMVDKWNPSLKIGVIQMLAGCTEIPTASTSSDECCVWSGNDVLYKRNYVGSLSRNLNEAKTGTVGVKYDTDGTLSFYMDSQCVGKINLKIPGRLHGVVDIYGKTTQVAIVGRTAERGGGRGSASKDRGSCGATPSRTEVEEILDLMQQAVQKLSNPQQHTLAELAKVIVSLEDRRSELSSDNEKQAFGDKFSEMSGGKALTTFIMYLRSDSNMEQNNLEVDLLTIGFCWNASHNSLRFCEAIGDAGLLEHLAKDLHKLKATYSTQGNLCRRVMASICILHNSAKAAGTKEIFKKKFIREALRAYCDASNHKVIAAASIQGLSYICVPAGTVAAENLNYMIKMLAGCTQSRRHNYCEKFIGGSPNFYAIEILESVTSLAGNDNNRKHLVESGVMPHLVWMLQNGGTREREQAANAVWTLVGETTRWKISQTKDIVESLTILKDTENEAKFDLIYSSKSMSVIVKSCGSASTTKAASQNNCEYRRLSSRLFKSLQLDDAFFNKKFDACYCAVCHAERGDDLYYSRGEPEKDYGLPIGWFRFALQVPARASAKDVDALKKWHRCFHGTKKETLKKILEIGELLQPGDVALGGKKLGEREGHFTDDRKPSGFDTKQIFLSPSIRYSGHCAYSTPFKFKYEATGNLYVARVAFQVFVRPGSYETGDQTIGATEQIDPRFSNQELEWSTKERGAIILYGLLVKLDESLVK